MAEPILKLTRGVPTTDRGWMDVFKIINRFFKVSGDELVIGGSVALPDGSVSTPKLADKAVTDPKLRDSQACSIVGRPVNTAGSPTDIQASTNGHFLRRAADVLGFGPITDADIPGSIARDSEVASAVSAHEGASDPHPQYLTQTEGDARYRELTDVVTYGEITSKPAALALLYSGTGSPETVVTAGVGSLFLRTDGGASTTLYIKESGAGNTGWIAK